MNTSNNTIGIDDMTTLDIATQKNILTATKATAFLNAATKGEMQADSVRVSLALAFINNPAIDCTKEPELLTFFNIKGTKAEPNKKKHPLYNQVHNFYSRYVKPIQINVEHLTPILKQVESVDLTKTYSDVAKSIFSAIDFGKMEKPTNRAEWIEFLNGFIPTQDTKIKTVNKPTKTVTPKKPVTPEKPAKAITKGKQADAATVPTATVMQAAIDTELTKVQKLLDAKVIELTKRVKTEAKLSDKQSVLVSKAMLELVNSMRTETAHEAH